MKVLVTQDCLATRSTASKSRLSILEPAGPRLPPSQQCLEVLGDEIVAKNFFCITYFHGLSAARPLGWALRMTSGKVRKFLAEDEDKEEFSALAEEVFRTMPRDFANHEEWCRLLQP